MPASSRKRNKGKERKAKKAENDERARNHDTWFFVASGPSSIQCDHGCADVSSLFDFDHPVSSFMNEYYSQLKRERRGIIYIKENF